MEAKVERGIGRKEQAICKKSCSGLAFRLHRHVFAKNKSSSHAFLPEDLKHIVDGEQNDLSVHNRVNEICNYYRTIQTS